MNVNVDHIRLVAIKNSFQIYFDKLHWIYKSEKTKKFKVTLHQMHLIQILKANELQNDNNQQ